MEDALGQLRSVDRRDYLGALLAPGPLRDDLAVLLLYGHELARIPLRVTEPAAGEIRLQWWEEVVRRERPGEAAGNPLARALLDVADRHELPASALAGMADARRFDLYSEAMPDRSAFETYAGATASVPIQIAAQVLDPSAAQSSADAAGHAGVYGTIVDRLGSLARDRLGGRQFLPSDLLWMAAIPAGTLPTLEASSEQASQLIELGLDYASQHRQHLKLALRDLPKSVRPAFAPTRARRAAEAAIRRSGPSVLITPPLVSPLREQWALWRSS